MPYRKEIGDHHDEGYISFSQDMTLGVIMGWLWPLSKMPGCEKKEI
jgi:hypothetical protein